MDPRHAPEKNGSSLPKDSAEQEKQPAPMPYVGKPLDGSQYHDVIEEQEYADQRPSQEEQKPRFSYLNKKPEPGRNRKQR